LLKNFEWVFAGQDVQVAGQSGWTGRSTTASDTTANAALSNNATWGTIYSSTSPGAGFGYVFRVPVKADKTWTIRVRGGQYSGVTRHTAQLLDGVTPAVSASADSGSGATLTRIFTTTVTPKVDCELLYKVESTSRYTADPSIAVGSVTVSGSF
jgi:hypothetical protein